MVLNITCGMDHIFLNQPLLIHWTKTSTHHYATLFFFFPSLAMNLIVSQNFAMSVKGCAMYQVHINHYQFWRPTINVKSSTSEEIGLSCCMLIGPFLRLYSLTMNISTSFIRFFTRVSQYERLIQTHPNLFVGSNSKRTTRSISLYNVFSLNLARAIIYYWMLYLFIYFFFLF